ncbi:hypothetical protein IH601_08215 [Candidatus Bipolaricaulota bacterium]|nr:hypothetical protein [Candidatus Bipolaricaulota bacterium]
MTYQNMHEFLRPADVVDAATFMEYAAQQLGVQKPIGVKARGIALKRIKEELAEQHWSYAHLVAAVRYMKDRGIQARRPDYVFYHVQDAVKSGFMPRATASTWDQLHKQVAEAIAVESDESWQRRLLMAKGKALQSVYAQWEQHHEAIA